MMLGYDPYEFEPKAMRHLWPDIHAHFVEQYPKEGCGYIWINDMGVDENGEGPVRILPEHVFEPMENVAENPEREFEFAPPHGLMKVEAVIHSHPSGDPAPSRRDMEQQIATAVPWAIVPTDGEVCGEPEWFGDQLDPPPLIGRTFLHGIRDCFSLVRHWTMLERGLTIRERPRQDKWWEEGEHLFDDRSFESWGFERIGQDDLAAGDILTFSVLGQIPNHCGVYLGDGVVLHHLTGRLSRREPLNPWMRHVHACLRFPG